MSILRKIPKIEQVLDNMSLESLKRLESLMNSGNGATETYTLFGGENKLNYVNKDLGVWYCNIELERNKSVETGFLIWESQTKALFISYDITQCLKEYEIDLTNYTYTKINEKLSIEEFRRVLEDNINKEVVHIDTSGNVEIGKNLVVDGKVILNGKEDLVDTSGNELISGSSGGGDIWLDIMPYLSENMSSISQEGYDLVSNAFFPTTEIDNPSNKYAGIIFAGYKLFFNELVISDKIDLNFIANLANEGGVKGYLRASIYNDKSFEFIKEVASSYKIWYEIPSISNSTITQDEYNELTNLINDDKLAGIKVPNNGYYTLFTVINGNYIFIGYNMAIGLNYAYISSDLSTKESYTQLVMFGETPSSQVIPSITNGGVQQNLSIGNGLTIENGALKTNIPPLPADASTKTYTLKAVNGVLTWVAG